MLSAASLDRLPKVLSLFPRHGNLGTTLYILFGLWQVIVEMIHTKTLVDFFSALCVAATALLDLDVEPYVSDQFTCFSSSPQSCYGVLV